MNKLNKRLEALEARTTSRMHFITIDENDPNAPRLEDEKARLGVREDDVVFATIYEQRPTDPREVTE